MIEKLINLIVTAASESDAAKAIAPFATEITRLSDEDVDQLLAKLSELATSEQLTPLPDEQGQWKTRLDLLIPVAQSLLVREVKAVKNNKQSRSPQPGGEITEGSVGAAGSPVDLKWNTTRLENFETLYLAVAPDALLPNHLLRWLATGHDDQRIELWVRLMGDQPPEHRPGIALSFAPLMDASFDPATWFLDLLIDAPTRHSQIAPAVYDLCNFFFRHHLSEHHAATDRLPQLNQLLAQLCNNLMQIESGKVSPNIDVQAINRQVADSVALIVALCDTFALVEYEPAVQNIVSAMTLRHRRVQTESAAALARLGYPEGQTALVAMAQEPVSRLRVLAYAEELGFLEKISLELQGEISIAESQLAIWLSEPEQMGLAPTTIQLMDNREMYWPSYEHPVQCFLFRYSYGRGENAHSNIGICGPLTHAFAADIRHLTPEDCYAMFAGWQTTHQEIFLLNSQQAEQLHGSEMRRLQGLLTEQQLDDVNLETVASFFGEIVLIATGNQDQSPGTAVVDQNEVTWVSAGNVDAPLDWELALAIWRGRRLLATFNHQDQQ